MQVTVGHYASVRVNHLDLVDESLKVTLSLGQLCGGCRDLPADYSRCENING